MVAAKGDHPGLPLSTEGNRIERLGSGEDEPPASAKPMVRQA
jgi:hypothetical protein